MVTKRIACVVAAVLGCSAVLLAADRVPLVHWGLHRELKSSLDKFDKTVSSNWNGKKANVIFGTELLTANSHRGLQLLGSNARPGVDLEMGRLAALGSKAITLGVNFPILYEPFHRSRGKAEQYGQLLDFYKSVIGNARNRGMTVIVESGIIFPGSYSAQSGFDVAKYYKTLSDEQFSRAKSEFVQVIVRELQPDYVNLGAEPDTEAQITKKRITNSPASFAALIDGYVRDARNADNGRSRSGGRTKFGAGVGSWQKNGADYVRALAKTQLDFIDIHVYPVNGASLDNLITFTDIAKAAGKPVAISEAWLLKQAGREFLTINSVSDPKIFARDGYSFWAPLDQQLLGSLVKFAAWKDLIYLTPYWSTYMFSYVDFDSVRKLKPELALQKAQEAAVKALIDGRYSETGEFWRCAIRYGPCLSN